ncbi:DUF2244 domain-containing protein [Mycolicibacterium fortuitum]
MTSFRATLILACAVVIAIPVVVFAVMGEWSRAGFFGVGLVLAVWALWQVERNHRAREDKAQ